MLPYAAKALSILLTFLCTMFSMQACGAPQAEQAALPAPAAKQEQPSITVNILQSRPEISRHLQEAADLYLSGRQDAALQINVQTIGNQTDYQTALRSRLLSGESIDLFHIFSSQDMQALSPYLQEAGSLLPWLETSMEGTLDAVTTPDGIYGIPYNLEGVGLIVNRDIFLEAGISTSAITGFDDLKEAFAQLQEAIDEGNLKEQYPNLEAVTEFAALDKQYLGSLVADLALRKQFSGPTQALEAPYIDFPEEDGARQFIRLMAQYSSSKSMVGLTEVPQSQQIENGLATQRVAVVLQSTEIYRTVYAVNPELEARLSLLPVPFEGSGSYITVSPGAYWAINNGSSPETQQAAADFLTWLYQEDGGTAVVAGRFSAVSTFRETAKETGNPLHSQMLRYQAQDMTLPRLSLEYPQEWGSTVFAVALQQYFTGDIGWDELLQQAKEQWHLRR